MLESVVGRDFLPRGSGLYSSLSLFSAFICYYSFRFRLDLFNNDNDNVVKKGVS